MGANTALRDAMLLSRALSFVQANRLGLCNAVAAYETEMVRCDLVRGLTTSAALGDRTTGARVTEGEEQARRC